MPFEKSRRPVLVLATLALGVVALGAQPAAASAKPGLNARKSMAWSGGQARRDGYVFFPAPRVVSSTAAPRDVRGGVCDHGDNPMIC